jgi:hypothetical protein
VPIKVVSFIAIDAFPIVYGRGMPPILKPTYIWLREVDLFLRICAEDDTVAANTLM